MAGKYKIVEFVTPKGVCRLSNIQNVKSWAYLMRNEPQAGKFPEDASFQMNDEFPKDVKLGDVLDNTNSLLVVSERVAEFLKKEKFLAHNEVHPVGIDNHKGRREKARYFIIHQIDDPKCVDEAKTVGTKSKIEKAEYNTMEKLVLDEKKIPRDYAIFRADEYKDRILVRSDVADKIEEAGFTGIAFFDLDDYNDYW
jgi:hypothetical protein